MNLTCATPSRLNDKTDPGQPDWRASIGRELIASGDLAGWIADDGLAGLSVNSSQLYNTVRASAGYRAALPALRLAYADPAQRYDALVLSSIQHSCELLLPRYRDSDGGAGLVSIPLAPQLAHDAGASLDAARRLWHSIGRPNAMLAIPATEAGIAALEAAIAEGINVNATLVFGPRQLQAVRGAHRRGLARRRLALESIQRIAVVATLYIGRIDSAVNALLPASAARLRGQAGPAAARLAWHATRGDSQFGVFAAMGAAPLKLVCSSSGQRELSYIEALIDPDDDPADARALLAQLARSGIDLDTIAHDLLLEGLTQYRQAHSNLLALLA